MKTSKIIGIVVLTIALTILLMKAADTITYNNVSNNDLEWVYIRVQTSLVRDTSDYYYYGQISKAVLDKIENNSDAKGLFFLRNIRYWNNDDLLRIYEDEYDSGYKVYRIQDIYYITPFKKDPVFIFDEEELHESAKKLRNDQSNKI